ncbi:MAG: inorganic diphosphatase [Rhodospirillaceae bacterium]|nr:MAG: inorganic diphosphatase [Rhodospirillaceae bacterium]
MDISKLSIGKNAPDEVNVLIEVPMGGNPVKYELDKESGCMFVDRFLHTAMHYPCNYGFIPHTLSDDGDPVDAAVLGQHTVSPGVVIPSRPVGVLMMEDEKGLDEKVLCVPDHSLHPYYEAVESIEDLRPILLDQLAHFFTHYKDLEKGKWVKVTGWQGVDQAKKMITEGVERAKAAK